MASPACCQAGPPVTSDYEPKGTISKIGNVDVYLIGSGPKTLIVAYDIFGFSTQTKQVCDTLAEAGFNVVMPDYFNGKPWLLENFPPKDGDEFGKWVGSAGDWDSVVHPATVSVMEHMKEHRGAEVFGLMGFCWGGKIAMKAAALGPDSGIKATATVHPAMLSVELAEAVKVPMLIMPSHDEPDLTPLKEVMEKKEFGSKCIFHRFDDMHHGFCAARGDWSEPEQAARASEAIGKFQKFFKENI